MSYTASRDIGLLPAHPGDRVVLLVIAVYAGLFVALGFVFDTPDQIFDGLIAITTSRDTLLTDYFGVGGVGAALVNAGLLTLISCLIYHFVRARMTGASVAALFLVLGFGLLGKNLLNVWLIVIGAALFGTNLASVLVPVIMAIQSRSGSVEFSEGPEDSPTPPKHQEQP